VKDHGGHSQPNPFITLCAKKQLLVIKYKNKQTNTDKNKQTNIELGDVNLQMKKACLFAQRSGSNLIGEIWCG